MFSALSVLTQPRYFITGTDTGSGKTFVTCKLLQALQQQGKTVMGIKPILTGATADPDTDTHLLMQHNSRTWPASMVTPYSFIIPTSPHIAAANAQQTLAVSAIRAACQPALTQAVDTLLIEGVGGWRVPLNAQETVADLAAAFACPIILVVGMRLGCLNHALLTAAAIQADGLTLAGWVANQIDPTFPHYTEYLTTLTARLAAPLLGNVGYQPCATVNEPPVKFD